MIDGVYVLSNPAMPNLVKIGGSKNIPRRLKKEANQPGTFKPPYPYRLEYVLETDNHFQKQKEIHSFLEKQGKRVLEGMNEEFFLVTPAEVLPLFQLMTGNLIDGETYLQRSQQYQQNDSEEDDVLAISDSVVTPAISELSADNDDEEEVGRRRLSTRYNYRDNDFRSWGPTKKRSFKSNRRDQQGLSNRIFTEAARQQGLRNWADWSIEKMAFILKENYSWITPEIRAVLKDCFPE